jgi:hypothetical protein
LSNRVIRGRYGPPWNHSCSEYTADTCGTLTARVRTVQAEEAVTSAHTLTGGHHDGRGSGKRLMNLVDGARVPGAHDDRKRLPVQPRYFPAFSSSRSRSRFAESIHPRVAAPPTMIRSS